MMMVRRHKPRRGVVLLVILTLLTLLIVVGITFTLISGHYRRAAEASSDGKPFPERAARPPGPATQWRGPAGPSRARTWI